MKKFQFGAGLLALGLLASCSSDAPEMVQGNPTEQAGPSSYVAMRINMNNDGETRESGGDTNATSSETKISDLTLYVFDGTQKLLQIKADELTAVDNQGNQYAYFNIGTTNKSVLENHIGHKLDIKVFANVAVNNTDGATAVSDVDATDDDAVTTTSAKRLCYDNHFVMSGKTNGYLAPSTTTKEYTPSGSSEAVNAWVINGGTGDGAAVKVALTRLVTRFDFLAPDAANVDADNFYTATGDDKGLKIKVLGLAINTHETKVYWFQKSAVTSITPDAGTDFTKDPSTDTCRMALKNHNYRLTVGKKCYARPHYVSDDIAKNKISYGYASYVAVKSVFKHATKIGDSTEPVYAVEGVLLGTFDYLKTKVVTDFVTDESPLKSKIATLLEHAKNGTEEDFASNDMTEVFTYDATAGGHICYYNRYLSGSVTNTANNELDATQLDLQRNHIYNISIKSFAGLGQNGDKEPNDPTPTGDEDFWIELDCTITPWISLPYNENLVF